MSEPWSLDRRRFLKGTAAVALGVARSRARADDPSGLPEGIEPYDWALRQMNVAESHAIERGSESVVVALIDLGYRHHPRLDGHLWVNPRPTMGDVHGWDFADDDATLAYEGPGAEGGYYRNHHVFVAGEVAAVAPGCKIMIVRVGYRNHESWWRAVRYAVDHGARVLVMPHGYIGRAPGGEVPLFYQGTDFAYPADNPKLRQALEDAYDRGCLIVSGTADNRGRRVAFAPVALEVVCAVGSANRRGEASNMAADADYVEFAAPAGQRGTDDPRETIWGMGGSADFTSFEGGCMASEFAGGVAALACSRYPELLNDQVRQVLRNTTRLAPGMKPDAEGRDARLGFGLLDARAAVSLRPDQLARDLRLDAASLTVRPDGVGFIVEGEVENQGVFDARKAMVVAYNGDPTRPADPSGTLDAPAAGLQVRQLGHAAVPVRGLHRSPIRIACEGPVPPVLWFETYGLDRHDQGRLHRARWPAADGAR